MITRIFLDIIKDNDSISIGMVDGESSETFYGKIFLNMNSENKHSIEMESSSVDKVYNIKTMKNFIDIKKCLNDWLDQFDNYEIWSYKLENNIYDIPSFDLNTLLYMNLKTKNIDILKLVEDDIPNINKITSIPVLRRAMILKNCYNKIIDSKLYLISMQMYYNTLEGFKYHSTPIAVSDNKQRAISHINSINSINMSHVWSYVVSEIPKI